MQVDIYLLRLQQQLKLDKTQVPIVIATKNLEIRLLKLIKHSLKNKIILSEILEISTQACNRHISIINFICKAIHSFNIIG